MEHCKANQISLANYSCYGYNDIIINQFGGHTMELIIIIGLIIGWKLAKATDGNTSIFGPLFTILIFPISFFIGLCKRTK